MMRALWSAASGMKAQQTQVDSISNNIANVNTVGYKASNVQFKTLLYQTLREQTTTANGESKPSAAQMGLGTRVASTNTSFAQGALTATDSNSALAIQGAGFFAIRGLNNTTYYTKAGNFQWSLTANGERQLSTPEGFAVLDTTGNPITLPANASVDAVSIATTGEVAYKNADGTYTNTGRTIGLFQFLNPEGLLKTGDNLYSVTEASGQAQAENNNANLIKSTINQGYLESSNVNVADEMVNLIVAQRAYELNSKAITTSDTMLEQANNLKR